MLTGTSFEKTEDIKMVHKFKFGVNRFLFDSESGYTHEVDELGYKMIDYIELPMADDCPSALRYDLAKYDSDAISKVYAELRSLSDEGKLFAAEKPIAETKADAKGGALVEDTDLGVTVKSIQNADNDVAASVDELTREAKLSLKAGKGSIFAPVSGSDHGFAPCAECHARHLCSLALPGRAVCDYERLRVDCELAAKALGQKCSI